MTHPFFPSLATTLTILCHKNQASWHHYRKLHLFQKSYFQIFTTIKVNAKVPIPCQIHKSMPVEIAIKLYKAFIFISLEYTSPLFMVPSKGLCAKLESINALITLRTVWNIPKSCNFSFYKEFLKVNGLNESGTFPRQYNRTKQKIIQRNKIELK